MPEPTTPQLTESEVEEIEARMNKTPEGPWFAASDAAKECGPHRDSGLALVDTGRESDWPIARLCEWHKAQFIAHSREDVAALIRDWRALRRRDESLEAQLAQAEDEAIDAQDRRANADAEAEGVLQALGDNAVRVREDGGPEDVYASLAVSVSKLQSKNAALRERLAQLANRSATLSIAWPHTPTATRAVSLFCYGNCEQPFPCSTAKQPQPKWLRTIFPTAWSKQWASV